MAGGSDSITSTGPSRKLKRPREQNDRHQPSESHKHKKMKNKSDSNIDFEKSIDLALGRLSPDDLAERIDSQTRRFAPDLSPIEFEEALIPATPIVDTTGWDGHRTTASFANFLSCYCSALTASPNGNSAPHTLIITMSGLRAADLARACKVFRPKKASIAKLFAKHIKLKDAADHCIRTRISIGVGTPARILDLLDLGALKPTNLERIVVDLSHIDAKKRGIIDMKDTQQPLIKLLGRREFRDRYGADQDPIALLFF